MNKRNSFVDFLEKFLKKTITVPQFLAQAKNHTDMLNIFKK
jgi:hypothetical protein